MKNDLPMRNDLPLTACGAAELAALIARRDTTARDVLEQHIARIAEVNPKLNAMCVDRFDAARKEADAADAKQRAGEALGPLHGVPVTIKECIDVQGMPSTFGLVSQARHRATADEVHVARLRAAGAIPMAKTNVAQALFFYEADNPVYGRTVNPWNADRTPGGSSGGEAALIAVHASPLGLGTDIGGSVRVPAAFCGIASIKPTAGRCDDFGWYSSPVGQRAIVSQVGPMARRAEDLALALRAINGGPPLGDCDGVDVKRLRVAYYTRDDSFTPAPAVERAVREAADAMRAAGAQVTEWKPPSGREAVDLTYGIYFADGLQLMKRRMGAGPLKPQIKQILSLAGLPRAIIPPLRALLRAVGQHSMAEGLAPFGRRDTAHYWELVEAQLDYARRFANALDTAAGGPFDVILCPPCALPALTHGASKDLATLGAYACLYNLLGYPAGVVPVTRVRPGEDVGRAPSRDIVEKLARQVEQGSAGLPVGVQVVARPWQDHVALAAMRAVEAQNKSSVGSLARSSVAAAGS
jgi:fatty acid amide hydrolase